MGLFSKIGQSLKNSVQVTYEVKTKESTNLPPHLQAQYDKLLADFQKRDAVYQKETQAMLDQLEQERARNQADRARFEAQLAGLPPSERIEALKKRREELLERLGG